MKFIYIWWKNGHINHATHKLLQSERSLYFHKKKKKIINNTFTTITFFSLSFFTGLYPKAPTFLELNRLVLCWFD